MRDVTRILFLTVGLFLVVSLACALVYFIASATPWLHLTYGQISVSFAVLTVLSFSLFVGYPTPRKLYRKFAVPRATKAIAVIGFMVSVILFAFFAYITATSLNTPTSRAFLLAFYAEFPVGHGVFGVFGFAFFVSAFLSLMACLLDRGIMNALKEALQFFLLPALMIFELGLLLVDTKEMPRHVTMFLASTPLSGILTNWFVLVVSSGLFAVMFMQKSRGL